MEKGPRVGQGREGAPVDPGGLPGVAPLGGAGGDRWGRSSGCRCGHPEESGSEPHFRGKNEGPLGMLAVSTKLERPRGPSCISV